MESIKRFFAPPIFQNEEKNRAAALVNNLLVSLIHLLGAGLVVMVFLGVMNSKQISLVVVGIIILFGLRIPLHRGYVKAVSWCFAVILTVIITFVMAMGGSVRMPSITIYVLVSVIVGLTQGSRAAFLNVIINIIIVSTLIWAEMNGYLPPVAEQSAIQQIIMFAVSAILTVLLINQALKRIQSSLTLVEENQYQLANLNRELEQRVADATSELQLAAEIGQRLSLVRKVDLMLTDAVETIRERFELYYTQVYLTDPSGHTLILRAGTGKVGKTLLSRNHRLQVDMNSLNGLAVTERRSVIMEDTESTPFFRANPLLPDTRSEMVIPLLVGERVLGVLDVQSRQPGGLSGKNLIAFEALAGQLAIAVVNGKLFEETERAKAQVEALASRLTQTGWHNFMDAIERSERIVFSYDRENNKPLQNALLDEATDDSLIIPIRIAGVQIGKLNFQREEIWTDDEQVTANTIAQQVAQQIENLRLLAQSEQYQAETQESLRRLTREGWAGYQDQIVIRRGFVYQNHEVKPLTENENGFEGALKYPVKIRDEPIGELAIAGVKTLSEDDAELVTFINKQLSGHLENLRLFSQIEIALAHTDELYGISQAINEATTEAEILEALVRPASENGAISAILMYLDSDEAGKPEWTEIVADWRVDAETPNRVPIGTRFYLPELPLSQLWMSDPDHPILISNISTDKRIDAISRTLLQQSSSQALGIIPFTRGRERIGLLIYNWDIPHKFNQQEKDTYQAIIGLASPAIHSRRLFEQARTRSQELDILNEMGRTLTSLQDEQAIYETIFKYTGKLMDVNSFFIAVYNKEQHEIALPVFINLGQRIITPNKPAGNGLINYIINSRQPLLISSDFNTQVKKLGIEKITIGDDSPALSWLGVPLVFKDRVIGIVTVQSNTTPGLYTERERDLLTAIASQAAVALENAHVFRKTQQQAEQEATINLINQRIQSTNSVENALQVAIRELGKALGAKRANVQLGFPTQQDK